MFCKKNPTRKEREKEVVQLMVSIYCHHRHHSAKRSLCTECTELLDYAECRIGLCPKGDRKRSCRVCEIHCYSPLMREKIRDVMRFSGPRMILKAPITALRHLLSEHLP